MIILPNNLNVLQGLLVSKRMELETANKRYDHFCEVQESEFVDKYISAPAEEARMAGKTKEEIEKIKIEGKAKAQKEYDKARSKKKKELKMVDLSRNIKKIKAKIEELLSEENIGLSA